MKNVSKASGISMNVLHTNKKEIIMEGMYIVLGGVGIVACCLYLWSAFTKSGKKWIESL